MKDFLCHCTRCKHCNCNKAIISHHKVHFTSCWFHVGNVILRVHWKRWRPTSTLINRSVNQRSRLAVAAAHRRSSFAVNYELDGDLSRTVKESNTNPRKKSLFNAEAKYQQILTGYFRITNYKSTCDWGVNLLENVTTRAQYQLLFCFVVSCMLRSRSPI